MRKNEVGKYCVAGYSDFVNGIELSQGAGGVEFLLAKCCLVVVVVVQVRDMNTLDIQDKCGIEFIRFYNSAFKRFQARARGAHDVELGANVNARVFPI